MNKKFLAILMLASFLSTPLSTFAAVDANTVPSLNNVINGEVSNTSNGLNVQVGTGAGKTAGAVGQFDWNHFNVGKDKTVNFSFTNVSQTALNRVLSSSPTEIMGKLTNSCAQAGCTATENTGKVILINPNGILFGAGSQVNLNSFTASTFDAKGAKNISDLSGANLTNYKNSLDSNFGPDIKINFASTSDKIGSLISMDAAKVHADKSLVILAKDIEVKNGSVVSTTLGYNYGGGTQTFSNIQMVAANGADVTYEKNGFAADKNVLATAAKSGVDYTINMSPSTTKRNTVESGNVTIRNTGATANSAISIKGTDIKAQKSLGRQQMGDVVIWADGKTNMENSTITTINTYEVGKESTKNTYDQDGGQIRIYGTNGINLDSTQMVTAHSTTANGGGNTVVRSINGDVKIVNGSEINSLGNVTIEAAKNVDINTSTVQAKNRDKNIVTGANLNLPKDVVILGLQTTNITNSRVGASGNVTVDAGTANNIKGSTVYAGGNMNLYGTDTLIENSKLGYNALSLYKTGQINNVTVKGTTTFDNRSVTDGSLTLTASGNFTADSATLKKAPLNYYTAGAAVDHTKVTLNSNTGNVSFINGSNVKATGEDITANALNGSVKVLSSKLDAARDVNLNAKNSFTTGTDINSASAIVAGRTISVTVNGTGSDIVLDKPVLDKLTYGGRLKLNANRDVKLSSTSTLNINSADLNAGRNNEISATGNVKLSHTNLKAVDNKITTNGSVEFNRVALLPKDATSDTTKAATKTTVTAGGNVFTSTGEALDTKGTKLIVNTPGNVTLALAGSNNQKAGVEVAGNVVTLQGVKGSIDYTGGNVHSPTLTPATGGNVGATLSISRIVANRLNLDKDNKFIAAQTTLTGTDLAGLDQKATPGTMDGPSNAAGRAYIEVKEAGGFNLDTVGEYVIDEAGNYKPFYTGSYKPEAPGSEVYEKHFINLPGASNEQPFLLVYDKKALAPCPPEPPVVVDPSVDETVVRLPLQNEFAGKGQIVNNITDATSNIVAAAAGIVLTDDQQDDDYTLETY